MIGVVFAPADAWVAEQEEEAARRPWPVPPDAGAAYIALQGLLGGEVRTALVGANPRLGRITLWLAGPDFSPVSTATLAGIQRKLYDDMPTSLLVEAHTAARAPSGRWWQRVLEQVEQRIRRRRFKGPVRPHAFVHINRAPVVFPPETWRAGVCIQCGRHTYQSFTGERRLVEQSPGGECER